MAKLELTRQSLIIDAQKEAFELLKYLLENDVTNSQAKSTALLSRITTLDTAVQAATSMHVLT